MASIIQVVDGREVRAVFRRDDGTYKPVDESDAYERAARNQYLRQLRRERVEWARAQAQGVGMVADCRD